MLFRIQYGEDDTTRSDGVGKQRTKLWWQKEAETHQKKNGIFSFAALPSHKSCRILARSSFSPKKKHHQQGEAR